MGGSLRRMLVPALALAGLLTVFALDGPALAQAPTTRVRGVIDAIVGSNLDVATRDGMVALRIAETTRLSAVAKAALEDIKPGSYVGIAAMPQPDGSQIALEVVVFPEALRGAGEGHRPWDLAPESTMTNATVADTVSKVEGRTLTLTYKDGRKAILLPPEIPIVTLVPATREDLKPGVRIFSNATTAADGVRTATSVVVGRDGVAPPM